MLDPTSLFQLSSDQPSAEELSRPILLYALSGFVDAGRASQLVTSQLLEQLEHRVLATFDVDQVYDYRARRPVMTFDTTEWVDYEDPKLQLHLLSDEAGTKFLLLTGPEPDLQWERFCAATAQLVSRYGVRLSVGLHGIPMGVPHTRPIGVIAHGTRPELITGYRNWVGRVQVPGHMIGLLEFRLGQAGHDVAGFSAHVPHYLAQNDYPASAVALLEAVNRLTGLRLPIQGLSAAAEEVAALIAEQLGEQPEVQAMVLALEEQYDAMVADESNTSGVMPDELPTGDELGAELERFLAAENERRGRGES